MNLRQLRYFVSVAEAGTMTRAAARCRVAQPSLTQQVRKLESSLGVLLFDRLGRGVALTDAGRALLPRARRILAEVKDAEASLHTDVEAGRGRLSVGAIPTMAPYLLPPVLARLRHRHPECEIVVREDLTEHLVEAVLDNEIDVALLSTPVDHELLSLDVVGSEPLHAVVSTSNPLHTADSVRPEQLRDEPTITLHEMHCLGQQISGFCVSRQLARHVVCRTTQLTTVLEFVRLGMGVSIVPAMAAAVDTSPERVYLRLRPKSPRRDIALASRVDRTRSLVARRLRDLLAAHLKSASAGPGNSRS